MRLLRIVPDETKFDFMRFRRISFPVSAAAVDPGDLSLLLSRAEFRHRLRRRHADRGAIEERSRRSRQDARHRQRPRPGRGATSAIRRADRCAASGGAAARRRGRAAGGGGEDPDGAWRLGRLSPRRGGRASRFDRVIGPWHHGLDGGDPAHPGLSLVPIRMAVRARRHGRQRARHRAHHRLHVDHADRLRSHQHRGAADHPRLFAERHRGHLRPHS